MELQYSELQNNVKLLKLSGKLDIGGVGAIETRFAGYCSGEKPRVVVDLSSVYYLSSIGIRLLALNAKSVANRGGRMFLLSPIPDVRNVLEVTGIPMMIPIHDAIESAEAAFLSQ
jgi:anti-sigma B factor antagonist